MSQLIYTCSVCAQTFNDEYSLSDHMITNHSTKTEVYEEGETK